MSQPTIDRAYFLTRFDALPPECDRAFEKQIVALALSAPENQIEPPLMDILKTEADSRAYAAYCTLHTCYRRMHDHSQLLNLEKTWGSRFSSHPSVLHMELLAYVDMGEKVDGEHVLRKAERSIEQMPGNAGAQHLLADLTACYYEENPHLLTAGNDAERQRHARWLSRAVEAVDQSIALDEYPKFYATRARLLSLQHKYGPALASINRAIDREDSSRPDYAIRMAKYLTCKMQIEAFGREHEMRRAMDEYRAGLNEQQQQTQQKIEQQLGELSSSSIKNLEFLGLFAGIVSFTIGGVSIASNASAFSFQGAAGLLVVLLGSLLEVFCGFGFILHGCKKEKLPRNLVVMAFGAVMLAVGLWLCAGQ